MSFHNFRTIETCMIEESKRCGLIVEGQDVDDRVRVTLTNQTRTVWGSNLRISKGCSVDERIDYKVISIPPSILSQIL